jgi:hypothetical protein
MIVRILSTGKSFAGVANYLSHDANHAKTSERINWTHTHNLANDDVPCAVNEMLWTARDAELLKQEAGVRAGGRATENTVKHLSLNWSPEDKPTREHMIETTEDFLRHQGWADHQAVFFSHTDKPYAHVHVMLNMIHPETGLRLDDNFERRRAQAWALEYERENGRVYCEQRLKNPKEREKAPPRNMWLAFQENEKEFANSENQLRHNESPVPEKPKNIKNSEWEILKEIQRSERIDFFSNGKSQFSQLRNSIYREVRMEFRERWADYYSAKRGRAEPDALATLKAELVAEQKAVLTARRDEACSGLREARNQLYRNLLDDQREVRTELRWRQEAGLDNAPFLSQLSERNARTDVADGFRDAAYEIASAKNQEGHAIDLTPSVDNEPATYSSRPGRDDVGPRLGFSVGSLFDALFRDLTNLGSAPQAHEHSDPNLFQAAAGETQTREQREREEEDAERRDKQRSVSWG